MKKIFITHFSLFSLAIIFCFQTHASSPAVLWQKCYGGNKDDFTQSIIKLSDGNFLTAGGSASHNGTFKANRGGTDAFLMKTDQNGNIIWKKSYGGKQDDIFENTIELSNGDIYAIGTTASNNGQVSGHHGAAGTNDVWLIRTNANGDLLSQHCYGGSGDEAIAFKMIMTAAGNLVFVSETNSTDGDVLSNHGDYDGWVVKLNPNFTINFSVTVGDTSYDDFSGIDEVPGGFIVTGTRASRSSSVTDLELYYDTHAARLDQNGNIVWYRIYGGSRSDDCNLSVQSSDGNQVLAGHSSSIDGDAVGNNGFNMWVLKINSTNGNIIWQNFIGEPNDTAAAFNIFKTQDGGFVLVGAIAPNELFPFTTWDAYMAKVDVNGNLLWKKLFGGTDYDAINAGVETNDSRLMLAGSTTSDDAFVVGNHGGPEDAWLLELAGNPVRAAQTEIPVITPLKNSAVSSVDVYPNPASDYVSIKCTLTNAENIVIIIYDVKGNVVQRNESGLPQGDNEIKIDLIDLHKNRISPGIYFVKVSSDEFEQTVKLNVSR
jgi:hypothetical protein